MRTFELYCKKLKIFLNLWCVCTDKRGETVAAMQKFLWTGEGQICADVFYGANSTQNILNTFFFRGGKMFVICTLRVRKRFVFQYM